MTDKAAEFKKKNAEEVAVKTRQTEDGKTEYLYEPDNEWVSKNEHKKRLNKAKKDQAAAEKAAAKKEKEKDAPKKEKKEEEELDPTKYRENRMKFLENMREDGKNPYPHKF